MIKENRFLPRKKIPASQKKFLIQNLKDLLSQDQELFLPTFLDLSLMKTLFET